MNDDGRPQSLTSAAAQKRRGSDRWFPALCALLALLAAVVSLTAPVLRPRIVATAVHWLGAGNVAALLLAPAADAPVPTLRPAAASDIANLREIGADRADVEGLSRAIDHLARQLDNLREAVAAANARARAAALLALTLRLRRDVDAGAPIDRDVAGFAAGGPYPGTVDRALARLRAVADGTPTMRDLADEFDHVIARMTADTGTSWAPAGWSRVAALFGGGASPEQARLIAHLRALATQDRFSEAASELAASGADDIGASWIARVHRRGDAVQATQTLLAYSLAVYENSFAVGAR